jgi:pilus assembly protein Flp/PilA
MGRMAVIFGVLIGSSFMIIRFEKTAGSYRPRGTIGRMATILPPAGALMRHPAMLIRYDRGQGLAEYALILALIAVLCIAAVLFLGGRIQTILSTVGNKI